MEADERMSLADAQAETALLLLLLDRAAEWSARMRSYLDPRTGVATYSADDLDLLDKALPSNVNRIQRESP